MSYMKKSKRWILALVVLLVFLFIYRLTRVPEKDEEAPEQVAEIEWHTIDRIEFIGNDDVQIVHEDDEYSMLLEDTTYRIDAEKMIKLFEALNKFQRADITAVEFDEWIKAKPDTSYYLLKLFRNTEEVVNLYITPGEENAYFRYLGNRQLYQTSPLQDEQFMWLDSLMQTQTEN